MVPYHTSASFPQKLPALRFYHVTLKAPKPLPPAYHSDLRTVGDHLRKKRLDRDLLQKDVSQMLSVDTVSVTNWEKGRSSPRLHLIPRITQ